MEAANASAKRRGVFRPRGKTEKPRRMHSPSGFVTHRAKALGIKAPKGTAAVATLDAARAAYIGLLGSLGSNAEVKAEVTCFCEQLDQMQLRMLDPQLRMLDPKARKRPTTSSPST